jgi:spermidine/putrescine transport system ATP-binding protein
VPAVNIAGLERRFGAATALAGVSLTIQRGEFFSLLGPSGCGKTTLLRIIAGLDRPDAGTLQIGGVAAAEISAHRRPVNTVFQSYALFPHLTVRDNVAFGLRMKKVSPAQISARVARVMTLVQLTDLAQRYPAQLSGGQKQRVALARALVNEPDVLLLDEPLGALDLKLRKQLQVELHQLQRRLGITFIYVTHDQEEALVMSDRIAVMNAGRIEQLDRPEELYERPRRRFVAQFLGSCNLIAATVAHVQAGEFACESPIGELRVQPAAREGGERVRWHVGQAVTLAIRPEKIQLARLEEQGGENWIVARIVDLVYSGAETQYHLRIGDEKINAVALNTKVGHQGFAVGTEVRCYLPEPALIPLDD